ncbi:aldehyde dehydrogenase family protein [Paraburkholderia kururiensis]|uniref:aldehyde dehydrogenase family protein n=1 Tax=Paraburkholderia kururiensis TaxID=984307 RepID=UPI00190FAACD|nr:aldehyde dehydrogenase family protein [Paraburkholderia kururiensis]
MTELARKYFQPEYGHFIDGEWVKGASGETIELLNPSNGERLSLIQAGNAADATRAVEAAARAFKTWSRTHPMQRAGILREMARRLQARVADYAMMETLDNGKPIRDSQNFDIPATAATLAFFADTPLMVRGHTSVFPDSLSLTLREPLGVCVGITPWNIPLYAAVALKMGPALAAGNTFVLKPAETTCLAVLEFFKECADLLPPGVVNIVTGYGSAVGEALVTHPAVRKVAFTGSKPTARKIMQYASTNIIPQTMELGGKSANIVCEDADIDAAVEGAVMSTVFNKGEVCIAGTRTFVHKKIYDEFVERFKCVLSGVVQGDPTQMATQLGPQASRIQYDKVCSYLALGASEGARVVTGGKAATVAGLEKGLFIEPTIFADVRNDTRIAQEEIFGPVTCVLPWSDDQEVLDMANASPYGLGGGVWTNNLERAQNFARSMDTGTVWVNRYYNFVPGQPLGGFKQSGFGREGCYESLDHYTQLKAVVIAGRAAPMGLY